jgi:hypothetical protein
LLLIGNHCSLFFGLVGLNFNLFMQRWMECQKNLKKWSKKDREDFLRDMNRKPKANKKHKRDGEFDGEENNN